MNEADTRPRILFVAEAATLAHVTRPLVLARSLDTRRYDIHFACSTEFDFCFEDDAFTRWPLHSFSSAAFLRALEWGTPLYSASKLAAYIPDDLRLLDAVKPDLVVGDFRLSLAVSAPLRGVCYASITNAHWSPYSTVKQLPLPEHPFARLVGEKLAERAFKHLSPAITTWHASPANAARKKRGLPPLGTLRDVYTHADHTLYADVPSIASTSGLPPNHHYLGPILWSPRVPLPAWWSGVGTTRPCIYVTLGSSGAVAQLPRVVKALSALAVDVIVATAGRISLGTLPPNVHTAAYVPGVEAAKRSQLVVGNGGSPTVYQALAAGVPVLGIPANMDQFLTMESVAAAGAGILLRASRTSAENVGESASRLMGDPSFKSAAVRIADEIARFRAPERFAKFVDGLGLVRKSDLEKQAIP